VNPVTVYIDADSCPVRVREIICRAAERRGFTAHFIAAREIPLPKSPMVRFTEVEPGQDAADRAIVDAAEPGDMVVTRDIPLAAELVEQGVTVINDRGDHFTRENIRPRLSERDFMAELRSMGLESMRDRSYSNKEVQAFSAIFDRELTRLLRSANGD
jgi:uncharacterized protein YaiI (UPF0178 family)